MQRVWRSLERVPPPGCSGDTRPMAVTDLARELEELIAALDRRLPRVEQAGEADIVRDAAALREKAVDRLAQLAGDTALPPPSSVEDRT